MRPASELPGQIWGVSALINYIRRSFENDPKLRSVAVRGEITGYQVLEKGVRFRLREPAGSQISCWAWPQKAADFPDLANGLDVVVLGRVNVYPYGGEIQIDVATVYAHGAGKLAALYEKIKKKLQAEGLFALERKRPIPRYPFRVALVSSNAADGANDFLKRLRAEAPFIRVIFEHTPVQGPFAAASIADALRRASALNVDVVVVARGGGSEDDRLPFNEEQVARAIVASRHPVVTAIGHQADHHVADDVADVSAPTPTAAAALLAANFVAARPQLDDMPRRLRAALDRTLGERRLQAARCAASLSNERWEAAAGARAQRVTIGSARLSMALAQTIRRKREKIEGLDRRLGAHNPGALLAMRTERVKTLDAALVRLGRRAVADRTARLAAVERERARAWTVLIDRRRGTIGLLRAKLDGKNPEAILQQGYAIVRVGGRAVRDASALTPGDTVDAQLARGSLRARVEEVRDDG
jgi:exodeoxyribonuclease VII large subunit